jgi:tetratricopeptide (TPR) repeat protein
MEIKTTSFLKKGLTLFFSVMSFFMFGQNKDEPQIRKVFDQLVLAYGSAKTAPELVVTKQKQDRPAFYKFDKKPIVTIDTYLFTICRSFGKDSLNALSVVIGHELAHYYNEHSFCTDFAFAIRNKNEVFSKKVKLIDKNQKIIYETQADDKGLFYAAIAGYDPFEIQPRLLDAIYTQYQLKDFDGYPTKVQRKEIAKNALLKAKRLYETFKLGLKYIQEENYDKAIESFNIVNNDFPSRENYNNLGVAKTRQALDLKELSKGEDDMPKRFQYPLEVDNTSRLKKATTRSSLDGEKMRNLLINAQKDFDEAIRLDPSYSIGFINLACVYDLLGKHISAIAEITEKLPKNEQDTIEAKQILAIAYYNADMEEKAEMIWNKLGI